MQNLKANLTSEKTAIVGCNFSYNIWSMVSDAFEKRSVTVSLSKRCDWERNPKIPQLHLPYETFMSASNVYLT